MTNPDAHLPDDLVAAAKALLASSAASDAAVTEAERVLGMPLPGPLRDFYLRVGNGDAESFLGVAGGGDFFDGMTAPELYDAYMQDDPDADPGDPTGPWWRPGMLPFYYWGCIVFTAVDCTTPDARVVGFDEGAWVPDGWPLVARLADWSPLMPSGLSSRPSRCASSISTNGSGQPKGQSSPARSASCNAVSTAASSAPTTRSVTATVPLPARHRRATAAEHGRSGARSSRDAHRDFSPVHLSGSTSPTSRRPARDGTAGGRHFINPASTCQPPLAAQGLSRNRCESSQRPPRRPTIAAGPSRCPWRRGLAAAPAGAEPAGIEAAVPVGVGSYLYGYGYSHRHRNHGVTFAQASGVGCKKESQVVSSNGGVGAFVAGLGPPSIMEGVHGAVILATSCGG